MSNQIADCTIKSRYVIEVQNGSLDYIPKFAIFVRKRELCASALCSCKDWATTNLLKNKLRRFASLREGRMLPDVLRLTTKIRKFAAPFTSD